MKLGNFKIFLILIIISLAILFLDSRGAMNSIKSVVSVAIMPVQYGLYSGKQSLQESFSFLTFWKSGEERIKNLEQRNLELLSYEQRAKALAKENEVLRKQMGVGQLAARRFFPATVLFSGAYLEIAGGVQNGIEEGQTVVIFDNFVGRITKVSPRTSLVQLPSDANAKTPVKVGLARGLVMGQFNS